MIAARTPALSVLAAILAACAEPATSPTATAPRATPPPRAVADHDARAGLVGPSAALPPDEPRCGDLGPQRQPTPIAVDAPVHPRLEYAPRLALPLRSTAIDAHVVGTTSEALVVHTFHNSQPTRVDARYLYPLRPGASVVAFALRAGERRLHSAVRPHAAAGPAPADRFVLTVDAIPPDAIVEIQLRVVEPLQRRGDRFALVIPTAVDAAPVADDPGLRSCGALSVHVRLAAAAPISDLRSEHHTVSIEPVLGELKLGLTRELRPDRDLALSWRYAGGDAPQAHLLTQRTADGDGHLALEIHPPRSFPAALARPRELVIAVDAAPRIPAPAQALAREAVRALLTELGPADSVQLLHLAADTTTALAPAPLPASQVRRALAFLDDPASERDTAVVAGVAAALARPQGPDRLRVVLFVGDGDASDALLRDLERLRGDARVVVLGVRSAAVRPALAAIARASRGAAVFVDPADPPDLVAARLRERVGRPVLTDIQVDWGDLPLLDPVPVDLPDLHLGAPLVVRGRLRGDPRGPGRTVRISGTLGARPFELRVQPDDRSSPGASALAVAWASGRIDELLAADPDTARVDITAVALAQRLTTPYTALFTVEDRRGRLPGGETRTYEIVADLPVVAPQPWPVVSPPR